MNVDFTTLTVTDARAGLESGKWTALDLCRASKKIIEEKKSLNAFLEVFADAEEGAKRADQRIAKGEKGPLLGIPVAIKDNLLYKGHHASSGSKILEGYTATYDGTVIKRLREAGAVIMGRTNMDEFAMGSSNENSAYGSVKNPHDSSRVPGGSSGGSAAAVAMNGVLASLGSDTGGSIRQPASLCGVVGFKPSYGRVSRYGLMAMASSLDQIGPFGKTVADARAVYEAISGHDTMDATSVPSALLPTLEKKKIFRIGVPQAFVRREGIDKDVLEAFDRTLASLKKAGHTIVDIDLPVLDHALAVYYILMPAEVSSNLARFDGIRYGHSYQKGSLRDVYDVSRAEGFGPEVRRRILLGTYDSDVEIIAGGKYDKSKGYFIEPTVLLAKNPQYITMCEEIFGPILTIYVYDDNKWEETLELVDRTGIYALTGAIIAQDRYAIQSATKKLVNAAGNFYINDKCTGAVVGQQPFGGARGSGTNDKAGSMINLLRWVSPRTIKETFVPPTDYRYPFMQAP